MDKDGKGTQEYVDFVHKSERNGRKLATELVKDIVRQGDKGTLTYTIPEAVIGFSFAAASLTRVMLMLANNMDQENFQESLIHLGQASFIAADSILVNAQQQLINEENKKKEENNGSD
jgi:hypothetical protein